MSSMKQQLAQGLSHEDLIARSLGLAQSPLAQSVFLKLYTEDALAQARALDQRAMREPLSSIAQPLLGLPVSIKDLYDVQGECTSAGSLVLQGSPVAQQDAPAVQALKASGAIVLGRTNMTELAFSGIGINPHHGTPVNPCDPQTPRIPGGSSSGAAV